MPLSAAALFVLLGLATTAVAADKSGAPFPLGGLRVETSALIPNGPDDAQMPADACTECNEGCVAGFAFAGSDGELYIYDYGKRNLKCLGPSLDVTRDLRLLPGVPVSHPVYSPRDGAVAPDGTIYLLSDCGREGERYRLYTLPPGSRAWQASDPFDEPARAWNRSDRQPIPVMGAARIAVDDDSVAVLYDRDRRRDGGITIAHHGRLLPERERVTLAPGIRLSTGGSLVVRKGMAAALRLASGAEMSMPFKRGGLLGVDRNGVSYYGVSRPGPPFYLEAYDASGKLLGRSDPPKYDSLRSLTGKGDIIACPTGGLFVLRFEKRGLRIDRLRVGG